MTGRLLGIDTSNMLNHGIFAIAVMVMCMCMCAGCGPVRLVPVRLKR